MMALVNEAMVLVKVKVCVNQSLLVGKNVFGFVFVFVMVVMVVVVVMVVMVVMVVILVLVVFVFERVC